MKKRSAKITLKVDAQFPSCWTENEIKTFFSCLGIIEYMPKCFDLTGVALAHDAPEVIVYKNHSVVINRHKV